MHYSELIRQLAYLFVFLIANIFGTHGLFKNKLKLSSFRAGVSNSKWHAGRMRLKVRPWGRIKNLF
jgi:hypothetical protein